MKTKKQKVFEFSIESQMPKQNGKKYNQEYYNKSIKQKKWENWRKKQFESHTSHNSLSSIPYRSNDWSWNRTGIETIFSLSGNQLIQCLSLLYLSALLRGVATNMVCATPSVSSSIRRFYACNVPPLPPSPPQILSSS